MIKKTPATRRGYYSTTLATKYDASIQLPLLRTLHRNERQALAADFAMVTAEDTVLEIGAGTGTDTAFLANRGKHVTAIDSAEPMLAQLRRNLSPFPANLSLINSSFEAYEPTEQYDYVFAIGVLDYVQDWQDFLAKCDRLARKRVIVTLKAQGILPTLYTAGCRLSGLRVYTHNQAQLNDFRPTAKLQLIGLGQKLPFTWVLSYEPDSRSFS